ncbi:hypothetical protein P9112_002437 [Eukaryota sp. TZLM1-RC]
MLWLDKNRPQRLDELSYHDDLSRYLDILGQRKDIPHLLFYGPPGAGKKTRILCLLRKVFGSSVSSVHMESRSYKFGTSSTVTDVPIVTSSHHLEITPSDQPKHDRHIIQELIKEVASSRSLDKQTSFKVVVINDVDKLSKGAQHALRRTMEKYMASCRLILVSSSISRVIDPIRSRCLCIRVPAPSVDDISAVVDFVARKEGAKVQGNQIQEIVQGCGRNLRRALLTLEGTHIAGKMAPPDWEVYTSQIVDKIITEPSPKGIVAVRKMLYELLVHCVPCDVIFNTLTRFLLNKITNQEVCNVVIRSAAEFQFNSTKGSKDIYHLEAFVISVMSSLKQSEFGH